MAKLALALTVGAVVSSAIFAPPALAQTRSAAQPLVGYACMDLNASDEQMMDTSFHVPIMSEPSAQSNWIGNAAATVIVAWPKQEVAGYIRALRLDGKPGWISARSLKPWHNPGNNGQRCVPSLLANGRLGFDFR